MATVQIFGTKKCRDTQKAERFFRERGIACQFIDLAEKGMSKGELESVAVSVRLEDLIDPESREYKRLNLGYMDFEIKETLIDHPLVMKTPVVRRGSKAVCGYDPDAWAGLTD